MRLVFSYPMACAKAVTPTGKKGQVLLITKRKKKKAKSTKDLVAALDSQGELL